jgi:site-specific recombinase XerC
MTTWDRYIKDFVSYLKIERGLSENSIFAYQSDVIKLKDYSIENRLEPNQIDLAYLKTFIAELFDLGLSPRSQARIISGIKLSAPCPTKISHAPSKIEKISWCKRQFSNIINIRNKIY